MNSKQLIAIAVVIVVAVAAVAAALAITGGGDGDGDSTPGAVKTGAIYGNVNGDTRVDQTDISMVQDVIDGKKTLAEYPLADANKDDKVDYDDLDIVKRMSERQPTEIVVVNYLGENVTIDYPVKDYAFLGGTNVRTAIAVLGLADGMLANGTNKYISPILDKALYDGKESRKISTLSSSLTTENINTLVNAGARIVISEESGMSSSDEMVRALQGVGIDYLELNFKDLTHSKASISTMGILFGCEDKAERYNDWTDSVMETIVSSEGNRFGTATVLCVTMSNSVSGTESDYYAATQEVGGKNLADWNDKTRKFNTGDSWLYDKKYNADFMFHFKSLSFPEPPSQDDLDKYLGYFSETYTCKEANGYYLINGVLPLPVRNAVMAEIMYPECFEEGWSQTLFQEYVDTFLGIDFQVSKNQYIWHI